MELTPSAKSSFLAGMALALIAWLTLFHIDSLPLVGRFYKKEKVFSWIERNRTLSMIGTETLNFGVHGISNSNSVTFALGSTVVSALFIWVVVPFRRWHSRDEYSRDVLRGAIK